MLEKHIDGAEGGRWCGPLQVTRLRSWRRTIRADPFLGALSPAPSAGEGSSLGVLSRAPCMGSRRRSQPAVPLATLWASWGGVSMLLLSRTAMLPSRSQQSTVRAAGSSCSICPGQAGSFLHLQSQGTERMWEGQLPALAFWQPFPGKNPPLALPLVLLPLPGRVGSSACSSGAGPSHHPGCPGAVMPTSLGGPLGPSALLPAAQRSASCLCRRPLWRHLPCPLPAWLALLRSSPGPLPFTVPCCCWKSRQAPWPWLSALSPGGQCLVGHRRQPQGWLG